jgi:4-amino-4-deoxy-L-arabinose transferase-like glycosyltransferase
MLAGLFAVAGERPHVLWARALGAVLGTAAVGGVYWLARLLFDRKTGLLAAAMAAVYPGAVATSVFVLSEALFCPLMLLQFVLWVVAWRTKRPGAGLLLAGLAGVAAGAATLTRPSWLLFTPLAVGLALVFYGSRWRQTRIAVVMLAALTAAMVPWWVRNFVLVGRFVPTTLQVGASLYDGLNPRATGASNMWWNNTAAGPVRRTQGPELHRECGMPHEPSAYKTPERQRPGAYREYWRDRQLRKAAVRWARQHPVRVFQLAGAKFLRLWNVWPNEASFSSWPLRLAVFVGYGPVMLLAGCGAWLFMRRGWPYAVCLLPAAYFTALHVVFVGSIRYRQPAMLTLIVLAAGAAAAVWQRWQTARSRDSNGPT